MRVIVPNSRRKAAGFTLIEALAAIAVTAIAGSVLLLGTTTSIQQTDDSRQRTIASAWHNS